MDTPYTRASKVIILVMVMPRMQAFERSLAGVHALGLFTSRARLSLC